MDANRRDFMKVGGVAAAAATLAGTPAASAVEINALNPTPEQFEAFKALPDNSPVLMLNLLKFKPDGGQAEYMKYSAAVQPMIVRHGGKVVFMARAEFCLIGHADWDAVAIVQYPSKRAFIDMTFSQEYLAIHHHREAGLEGQVLYALTQGAAS
jgi:uncharacterized protein (DUF1330 family)